MHEQLLICITLQFWLRIESFRPCLLYNFGTTARLALIQRVDCAEVDLLVDLVLHSRREVVRVVVGSAFRVVVTIVVLAGEQLEIEVFTYWCCYV